MVALKLFVLCALAGVIIAQEQKSTAEILSDNSFVRPDGYDFEFKTSDGVSRKEEAGLITVGENQGIAVRGSYSYLTPDGQEYEVTFTADDKGYKPTIRIIDHSQQ
ncbi:endocuticle structural glycoprotein SgAbd-5-like [Bombyx mandarina]|uniref:Endocuticle structural glycoprotein SgAbd-5-like n=2 Tax=Bombyx TaxID=7090 RepID=A0A6J2JWI8_BOMMA|nr:cuticular protein RR-1 motif 25 precursor [Bombyx mori]XP_028032549.1 endocuticle structural glycoprotein SgAbd-5-like [Bombyx mandarina]FAA00527.1 TPA: putative cuticle protein [Bombyx mori]